MTVRRTNLTQAFANKIPKTLNSTLKVDWSQLSLITKNAHNDADPGTIILYINEIAKRVGVSLQYSNGNVGFFTKSKANRSQLNLDWNTSIIK
jgi:hypothetical protein